MNDAARPPHGPPRVEHLKQMLQYQDQAVVSRVLARNAGRHAADHGLVLVLQHLLQVFHPGWPVRGSGGVVHRLLPCGRGP